MKNGGPMPSWWFLRKEEEEEGGEVDYDEWYDSRYI